MSHNRAKQQANDLSNTHTNADVNQHKPPYSNDIGNDNEHLDEEPDELMERQQVRNTPFWIVGNKIDGYYLLMGKYRLSEVFNTIDEVQQWHEQNTWNIILSMIIAVNHTDKQLVETPNLQKQPELFTKDE